MTTAAGRMASAAMSWGLLIAAIPLGLVAGVAVLLPALQVTGSRLVAVGLAAVAIAGLPPALAIASLALGASMAWSLFLSPAPGSDLSGEGMQFWDLPTGSRIAYVHAAAVGTAHPTPVVLVQGGPGSPDRRAATLAADLAAEGFDVYAYHQLGAGVSSRLEDVEDYTVARHVADLDAIRASIGAERVHLVGGSWGGQLITSYIAAYPERVDRAAVSSPSTIWTPAYTDDTRMTEGGRSDQDAVIELHTRFILPHILVGVLGPRGTHALFPDDNIDGAYEAMVTDLDLWSGCPQRSAAEEPAPEGTAAGRGFGFWVNLMTTRDTRGVDDPRPVLSDVTTPVLVMRGECDYIAWPVTREYRELLPNATLVAVDDAGHVISTDQPTLYRELVTSFLRGDELPLDPYTDSDEPWGR